jgi:cohesin complex subunit SA-1/2
MDQLTAQSKIEVSATSKVWEPQRAYEKRLAMAMAKDKGLWSSTECITDNQSTLPAPGNKGKKPKDKQAKNSALVTSDEEESEVERLMGDSDTNEPSAPPRPQPVRRLPHNGTLDPLSGPEDVDGGGVSPIRGTTTPKARPRPKARYRQKSPSKSPNKSPDKSPVRSNTLSDVEVNGAAPVTPRKRGHSEAIPEEQTADEEDGDGALSSKLPLTPSADIQIRRKRVRH